MSADSQSTQPGSACFDLARGSGYMAKRRIPSGEREEQRERGRGVGSGSVPLPSAATLAAWLIAWLTVSHSRPTPLHESDTYSLDCECVCVHT